MADDDVQFSLDGARMKNLVNNIKRSGYSLADLSVQAALGKAMKIAQAEAIKLAPKKSGSLRHSITVVTRKFKNGNIWSGVGVKTNSLYLDGQGRKIVPNKYYYIVELGRKTLADRMKRWSERLAGSLRRSDRIYRWQNGSAKHMESRLKIREEYSKKRFYANRKAVGDTKHPYLAPAIRNTAQAVYNAFAANMEREFDRKFGTIKV